MLHLFKSQSLIMVHCSHVICACYKTYLETCLPRVKLRQITAEKLHLGPFAHSGR